MNIGTLITLSFMLGIAIFGFFVAYFDNHKHHKTE